jgi:hypothetical protein
MSSTSASGSGSGSGDAGSGGAGGGVGCGSFGVGGEGQMNPKQGYNASSSTMPSSMTSSSSNCNSTALMSASPMPYPVEMGMGMMGMSPYPVMPDPSPEGCAGSGGGHTFHHVHAEGGIESAEENNKRKRPSRPYVKPMRVVRPKFTHRKGLQCHGMNIKRQSRCRNAALMEYIGEQPLYCAEHIEQDPSSLYCKCKAPYQNTPNDKKRCKEIVLKEFGYCYKHYTLAIQEMTGKEGYILACSQADKLNTILNRLSEEASLAKKTDGDMYQRKNKLINKMQQMYNSINTHVTNLGSQLKEAESERENART